MNRRLLTLLVAVATTLGITLVLAWGGTRQRGTAPPATDQTHDTAPVATLGAFQSDSELAAFLKQHAEARDRATRRRNGFGLGFGGSAQKSADSAVPAAPAAAQTVAGAAADSVTNVQHAGVDEGGIVKLHGDHLVILRRGRLFTVAAGDGALRPGSAIAAYAPEIDPGGTWYDEMLIAGDTIAVIGYSYARGGAEIGLFDIDRGGGLRHRSTYHLRSNDYYSSRNYSGRLIGNRLVFYTPYALPANADTALANLPALRRWHRGATNRDFEPIIAATRIYQTARPLDPLANLTLHTVTTCDLARLDFACEATAVLGPAGRVFYVSPESVYVWVSSGWLKQGAPGSESMLYRLPLDGAAPGALAVSGSPLDQFSFLESADRHLNVLVSGGAAGDGMWAAERAGGGVSLLRVPLTALSDGRDAAPLSAYRPLPAPGRGAPFHNRFVAGHLLYGTGSGWGRATNVASSTLYAVPWAGGEPVQLTLTHGVDRIEALGTDAIVIGTDGTDLHFTSVRLGQRPALASRYIQLRAAQGELRSHGFFYKPDGADSGLLGLPVRGAGRPGYEHLFKDSASIVFLHNDGLHLSEAGDLASRPEGSVNDNCRASCVDWYGNARPLFLQGRIFALLGYELVEGSLIRGRIEEARRVSFAPMGCRNTDRAASPCAP